MKVEDNVLTNNDSKQLLELISENNISSEEYNEIISAQEKKIKLLEENQKNLEEIIGQLRQELNKSDDTGIAAEISGNNSQIQNINNYLENTIKVKNFNENITKKSVALIKNEFAHYKTDYDVIKRENNLLNEELERATAQKINITNGQLKKITNRLDTTNTLLIQKTDSLSSYINRNLTENTLKLEYKINDNETNTELFFNFLYNQNNKNIRDKLTSYFPSLTILLSFRKFGLKNTIKTIKGYYRIKQEGLFDIAYYIRRNAYLSKLSSDLLLNYLLHEENWNKMPNPSFNPEFFRSQHKDMPPKLNPLVYYALYHKGHDWKTQ